MSKIDELIQQLCPDGVEYKELGEVVNILDNLRKPISKEKRTKGNYPYYGANGIQDYVLDYIFEGTFLLMGEDGSVIKKDRSPILNWATGKIWVNNHAHVLSEKRNIALLRFIFYYLSTIDVTLIVHGTPPKINQANLRSIPIPIPPLEIQEEIVRILDNFTALEAELEAELEARKKQYEYYRNKLLSFEGKDVEWKTLGEIAHYPKHRIPANLLDKTSYVGVENLLQNRKGKTFSNYVPTVGNFIEFDIQDILIGNIRPYLKKIWYSNIKGGTNGDVIVIRINEDVINHLDSRFLYFLLSSDSFFDYDMQFAKGAKMPRGDKEAILKYLIPLPPISEQKRIVNILDKFDSLVNDISIGLPAEIEARRKQYEYYRGKLLSFKEINNG